MLMKNPLNKRILRELKEDFGKYLVIFLFMTLTIGFVSGFLVAGGSMKTSYEESFEKYNIEYGHFALGDKADDRLIEILEKKGVKIYENFYKDTQCDTNLDGDNNSTLRVFVNRKKVNKVCLMKGSMPKKKSEIAVDRMFADNNKIKIGDKIKVADRKLTVTGMVALSDYSALFSNNTDMMFDSVKFGVSIMTKEGFTFVNNKTKYNYSFLYKNVPKDEIEQKEMSDNFLQELAKVAVIDDYVPRYLNSAVNFTGNDLGSDKTMMIVILYILMVILAFVFTVTISHTIVKESAVIGTLRASGYDKSEILSHYIRLPMLVSFLAAITGNILGYTVFKYMVVGMYYGSYSLPTYKTIWNTEAFVLTTVVPMFIMLITNFIALSTKLSLSPLNFLRRDLRKRQKMKTVRLPDIKFFSRFRIRIILQNKVGYLTLFVGIVFANVLLLFGMMMSPLLEHYKTEIVENMIAKYQYILKSQVEIEDRSAEKYSVTNLKMNMSDDGEEINIYGVTDNSKYFKQNIEDGYYVSEGFADKYKVKEGDFLKLRESYGEREYKFKIQGFVKYPAALAVFMSQDEYNRVFEKEDGYFNGYFSNSKIDIDDNYVATCITKDDLTKTSRQLDVSMGKMFYLVNVFAVVMFTILIYLLTKLIIEKNTISISMVKILGYTNGEIGRLYLVTTTGIIILSMIISYLIAMAVIDTIYFEMMKDYSGWLTLYYEPVIFVQMFFMGMVAYGIVAWMQFKKIKNIPMSQALKVTE